MKTDDRIRFFERSKAMSTPTDANPQQQSGATPGSLVWFEIPADDLERAKAFYGALFGWKMEKLPAAADEYWHIDTGGADGTPDGGLMKRQGPQPQGITNYISVASVDESAAQVEQLGGKICVGKTAVPRMGYFVICQDPEHNTFALWERNERAR
jgi:predicted enzyme related to lactoylglutathione lyase